MNGMGLLTEKYMEPSSLIQDIDHIPVSLIQQAFYDTGMSFTEASQILGWRRDAYRLKRLLGFVEDRATGKKKTHIDYKVAVTLVQAWNLDPVDYGI